MRLYVRVMVGKQAACPGPVHMHFYKIFCKVAMGGIEPRFMKKRLCDLTISLRVCLARRWDRTTWDGTGQDGTGHVVLYCVWKA